MRGGVTVRAQDLTRLNRDVFGEIRAFHPLLTPKLNNITLRQAIKDYLSDDFYRKRYVLYRYGEIEDWDVSNVKNMKEMFMDASSFNRRQFRGKVDSDGFEKVLIGTRGASLAQFALRVGQDHQL